MSKFGRFVIYLLLNISLFWLKPLLRHFRTFDFMILVYPGTKEDILSYLPFETLKNCVPTISALGLVQKGEKTGRGLVVASKFPVEEVLDRRGREILELTKELANSLGVKKIGLAGRLPHLLTQTNNPLFTTGKKGTVFTIMASIDKIMAEKALSYPDTKIGVLGVGFIGRAVLRQLQTLGFDTVIGVDPRFKKLRIEDWQKIGPDFKLLNECDIVIVLTSQGDDIKGAIPYLKKGVIILDDTHPPISDKNLEHIRFRLEGEAYKVALGLRGVKFFPPLPNFENGWLPGCVIEALLMSNSVKNGDLNQDEFNRIASRIGFKSLPIQSKGEN